MGSPPEESCAESSPNTNKNSIKITKRLTTILFLTRFKIKSFYRNKLINNAFLYKTLYFWGKLPKENNEGTRDVCERI